MTQHDERAPAAMADREAAVLRRIDVARRRTPRLRDDVITLAHGAGGKASAGLVASVFLPAFRSSDPGPGALDGEAGPGAVDGGAGPDDGPGPSGAAVLTDAALLSVGADGTRVAFTTDSFVVKPLRFPGGSIGDLAVHGTVNDLAMMGARPLALAAAFVIEEGFAVDALRSIANDMAAAAARAHVPIVTGDTKVVDRGAADGLFITTSGVGLVPAGLALDAGRVQPGDRLIVSGTIGDHGMAVMLARGDLDLEADVSSDTAPLAGITANLLDAAPGTRWLRDATRGGLGTVCNELARDCQLAVVLDEVALPVDHTVAGACDLLGIDPLYVANEGKLVAVVPADEVEAAVAALQAHPLGQRAAVIGEVRADPAGVVVLRTAFGSTRIVDMLVGDPLPRIC